MPPPSFCSKVSTRSTGDYEPQIDSNEKTDLSSSNEASSDEESKGDRARYDGVGIVKSLLGPSFEDAVLKTFEFGKSLIQKNDENDQGAATKDKKCFRKPVRPQNLTPCSSQGLFTAEENSIANSLPRTDRQNTGDKRRIKKRIIFTEKSDKEPPRPPPAALPPAQCKPPLNHTKKLFQVSKIRSLDSDLKRLAPSPEKIKRQLEALIQINKDEPPEYANFRFFPQETPKFHSEITVMPSLCSCKKEVDVDPCSSAEGQSVKKCSESGKPSYTKFRNNKDRAPCRRRGRANESGICQAPEFLTSALGPTLDVSIIDNLKMMRSFFKYDGQAVREEESVTVCTKANSAIISQAPTETNPIINDDLSCQLESRMQELKLKVEELEQKEQCLIKQIEDEEKERDCKRKAFEEEEQKLNNMKTYLEGLVEEEKRKSCEQDNLSIETKYETLKQKIACEEEKLARLKDQHDCYKREIMEAKSRKEALKRNKSLLDAWDVIASKACHTKLPSYSKVPDLERKFLKMGDNVGNIHCCFMPQVISTGNEGDCGRSKSRDSSINAEFCCHREKSSSFFGVKREEPPFPIQRDVICGLHKTLKACCCSTSTGDETVMFTSDDELLKMKAPMPSHGKNVCRSRSDTLLRRDTCAKIVKVLWAITRINVFQDNCKTYEVMDATSTPPPCLPVKTEGIFVVKSTEKKCQQKRRCKQNH